MDLQEPRAQSQPTVSESLLSQSSRRAQAAIPRDSQIGRATDQIRPFLGRKPWAIWGNFRAPDGIDAWSTIFWLEVLCVLPSMPWIKGNTSSCMSEDTWKLAAQRNKRRDIAGGYVNGAQTKMDVNIP
jgi:hypothetical protein